MVSASQTKPPKRPSRLAHFAGVIVELAVNVAAPFAIYSLTKAQLGDVQALMLASAPPILWSIVGFIRERKLDAISILVLTGIALSLVGFVGGGGVKFLQLRENLVTGLVGLIFLGSAVINRPVIFVLARAGARRFSPAAAEGFNTLKTDAKFRGAMMLETLAWAFGLLAACAVNCTLVFSLPIETFLLVSGPISYAVIGVLTVFTSWHVPRAKTAAEKRLKAASAIRPA
ncbi:MAG TPA: VC0807 family protein [Hyphomonadaceae bacterium]|nr:VC0807 family protein [Hyphomonadaceae bacterium]